MIQTLCPSRHRASQLFSLLESAWTNCPNVFDFTILVRLDDDFYNKGYEKLFNMIEQKDYPYPAKYIKWVVETDCCKDFYGWLNGVEDPYMALFVDDCIFYRPLHPKGSEELTNILDDRPEVWLLTLREGHNTYLHSYVPWDIKTQAPIEVEEKILADKYIKWNASDGDPHYNKFFLWGWDSLVFRTEEYKKILNNIQFTNLRDVEHNMNNGANRKRVLEEFKRPCKVSPKLSCVFSAQWNTTHLQAGYHGGVVMCKEHEFNHRFLEGEVMDWQSMNLENVIKSCHAEPQIKWKTL